MSARLVLLRGINVGGKSLVPMAELRRCVEALGYSHVSTYIASGNLLLDSDEDADRIRERIDAALHECFELEPLVRVKVLTDAQLQAIVDRRPPGFGDAPGTYHSDAIFLIDMDAGEALKVFEPREGVDRIWAGDGVIYSQRLSAQRTKSRLSKMMGTPAYRSMTIRSWGTVLALADLVGRMDAAPGA